MYFQNKNGKPYKLRISVFENYAGDGTWTHTILLPQAPEACASANSATPANKDNFTLFEYVCQPINEKLRHIYPRFIWRLKC